jgi:pSer/pThr/pTyr-binding forkhead associated (FHA) protein
MPTFVIHALGRPGQKTSCNLPEIRVGRDPRICQIVLPGDTVSREHALFRVGPKGRWTVVCLSETNPIAVDGALISAEALVTDGSEVVIGTEFLLVFSESEFQAQSYLGQRTHFSRSTCSRCGWSGMVSTLRREPACPKCGQTRLVSSTEYQRDAAAARAAQGATKGVNPQEVRSQLDRLRLAKRSVLERIDNTKTLDRKELVEGVTILLGRHESCSFRLVGPVLGRPVSIAWERDAFVARSNLWFPRMKVNGRVVRAARLSVGDVIEIGRNRFRLMVT